MIPGLGLSLLSLVVVFYFADLRSVAQALQLADYRMVLASAMTTLGWLVVRSQVWRTLLLGYPAWNDTFFAINQGYLINNILPFRLGEVARAYLLARRSRLGFFQVFPSVIIERLLDLSMAVGLLLATIPLVVGGNWARSAAVSAGILVLVLYVGLFLIARYQDSTAPIINRLFGKVPILGNRLQRFLPEVFSGMQVLTNGNLFLQAIGWVMFNWIIAIGQYYVLMLAFFPEAQLLWAGFSLGVVSLGIAAPSSPGAVGVLELALVGALAVFGLNPSTALAFAFTLHAIQYILTGVLGAYALTRDGESLLGIYHRLQSLRNRRTVPQTEYLDEQNKSENPGNSTEPNKRQ